MSELTTPGRAAGRAPPAEAASRTHRDDGLDLARALTRATAQSTPGGEPRKQPQARDRRRRAGRVSGAHPDDRDPQLLDTTLGRLVDDHGWELDLRVHGVFGRWAELVGARSARTARPSRSPTAGCGAHRLDRLGHPAQAARARPSYAGSTRSSGTAP